MCRGSLASLPGSTATLLEECWKIARQLKAKHVVNVMVVDVDIGTNCQDETTELQIALQAGIIAKKRIRQNLSCFINEPFKERISTAHPTLLHFFSRFVVKCMTFVRVFTDTTTLPRGASSLCTTRGRPTLTKFLVLLNQRIGKTNLALAETGAGAAKDRVGGKRNCDQI